MPSHPHRKPHRYTFLLQGTILGWILILILGLFSSSFIKKDYRTRFLVAENLLYLTYMHYLSKSSWWCWQWLICYTVSIICSKWHRFIWCCLNNHGSTVHILGFLFNLKKVIRYHALFLNSLNSTLATNI
jgi:hypothetical protein